MNNPIITASGVIPALSCVKVSTTANKVAVCTSAADIVFGVTFAADTANGGEVVFQTSDTQLDIVTLRADGTIAAGDQLVPAAAGAVVTATVGQFVAMTAATSGQTLTAYKKKESSGSGGADGIVIAGTAANGFNYTFNSTVNSISSAPGSNANTISGGGNSANPNLLLNSSSEATCAYRTIGGGYDNVIGSTNAGDGAIASTQAGGTHGRIRRPVDVSDNPNPALDGIIVVPIAACFTLDQPDHGTIGGGGYNAIRNGNYGTIAGGASNAIMGEDATYNTGTAATIAGGQGHWASGNNSTIGGGSTNIARQIYGTIAGGVNNLIRILDATLFVNNSSTIAGGNGNEIYNADGATIAGGKTNKIGASGDTTTVVGTGATIGGGVSNTVGPSLAIARYSTIIGGQSNSTRRWWSTVLGGFNNTAGETSASQGEYSIACGRDAVANHHMAFTQGAGKFSVAGDAQASTVMLTKETTNATVTTLLPGNSVGGANAGILLIPTDTAWAFRCLIIGRATASDVTGAYQITGLAKNNSGTAAIVGTPTVTTIAEDTLASTWDASVSVSGGNLLIQVTGAVATTIRWVGRFETSEVTA